MNKRIKKKKAKQQLIRAISGLVEAAEEMQREQERRTRQAGISYIKYIEAVRERQYGIKPCLHTAFLKRRELKVKIINTGYMVRAPTPCAYRGRKPHPYN